MKHKKNMNRIQINDYSDNKQYFLFCIDHYII